MENEEFETRIGRSGDWVRDEFDVATFALTRLSPEDHRAIQQRQQRRARELTSQTQQLTSRTHEQVLGTMSELLSSLGHEQLRKDIIKHQLID